MTNPTLERAARALCNYDGVDYWNGMREEERSDFVKQTRAVLMAVLPTLERYDYSAGGYEWPVLDADPTGQFVRYADLQAILNDGEGE